GAVTSNRTGGFHEPDRLVDRLVGQLAAPVRGLDNMRAIAAQAARIYEIGPAAPLSKFFVTIGPLVEPPPTPEQMPGRSRGQPTAAGADAAAEGLGSVRFRRDRGVRLSYVVGGMGMGISAPALVCRLARAGVLAYLGTAGLTPQRIEEDIRRIRAAVGDA